MKKPICAALLILLVAFCGCTKAETMNTGYLPTVLGIQKQDSTFHLYLGGYVPAKDENTFAAYESRSITTAHPIQGFEAEELTCSMLSTLVIELDSTQHGLYPLYAPFVGSDDASAGMYLVLCTSKEELLDPTVNEKGDINTFLENSSYAIPTLIGYDIAMRTPAEGIVVPVVGLDAQNRFRIFQGAVFCNDKFRGYIQQEALAYIQMINKEPVEVLIPFETDNGSGLVRAACSCDVALNPRKDGYDFSVTVFANGFLVDSPSTHNVAQITRSVTQTIYDNCRSAIEQAKSCKCDVFGFTRLICALTREYDAQALTDLFLQSDVKIDIQFKLQDLTQVRM